MRGATRVKANEKCPEQHGYYSVRVLPFRPKRPSGWGGYNSRMIRFRMVWTLALSLIALPARAAETIRINHFVGAEAPRLGLTLVPGSGLGQIRLGLDPISHSAPLAGISAIPTAPQLAAPRSPLPLASPGLGAAAGSVLPEGNLRESLGDQVRTIGKIAPSDSSGLGTSRELGKLYSGERGGGIAVSVPEQRQSGALRRNGDGVYVIGRADAYDREVTRIVSKYKGRIDFSESTDVMDDAYAESYARVKILTNASRGATEVKDGHSAHIPMTLTWVDGVFAKGGKTVAVHTSRVFFHHAKNPQSEIEEGLRRVEHVIRDATWLFRPNGQAENRLGPLDEVVLGFDTRGYQEIKDYVKSQEAKINEAFPGRFRFVYLDEVAPVPQTIAGMRQAVNELILEHSNDGLLDVIEGVIYSRYTGLLLELKTAEYYYNKGYQILQGGRELFDASGRYITELDVVVRSPEGVAYLIEAKSARVSLTKQDVLDGKILYKLDTYQRNKARLEQADILGGPLNVVFSVDVGVPPADAPVAIRADYVKNQRKLMTFLRQQEKGLTKKYGFPVSFLFLYSVPGHDPVTPDEVAPSSSAQSAANGRQDEWRGGHRRHGGRR